MEEQEINQKYLTENYKEICKQKKRFADNYIKSNSINCKLCELEECNFTKPPYECEVAKVYIKEELPMTISMMDEESILVNKKLREKEIL